MLNAIIHAAVATGSESSPLSPTSQLSELLRVLQFAIAGGVYVLIKEVRKTRKGNSAEHGDVQEEIESLRALVHQVRYDLKKLTEKIPA